MVVVDVISVVDSVCSSVSEVVGSVGVEGESVDGSGMTVSVGVDWETESVGSSSVTESVCVSVLAESVDASVETESVCVDGENDIVAGGFTGSGADGRLTESIYSGSTDCTGETASGFIGADGLAGSFDAGEDDCIGETPSGFIGANGLAGCLDPGDEDCIGAPWPFVSFTDTFRAGGFICDVDTDFIGAAMGVGVEGGEGRSFLMTGDISGVICDGGSGGGG